MVADPKMLLGREALADRDLVGGRRIGAAPGEQTGPVHDGAHAELTGAAIAKFESS